MPPRKKAPAPKRIEATKHKDKRKNIPTEELREFVKEQEGTPGKLLYPRDPSLDPQLVWKGKDEQDREDLAVPVVPVYIQEKVQPRAIIENVRGENVRAEAKRVGAHGDAPSGGYQPALFDDFNGIEFDQLIEFYQHEQNWSNRMILGDSLLVMASLAEKEGLKGKVQMIYIDPPYGIKFGSNWQVSTRKRDVRDGRVEDVTRQPEQIRAFRDTWELGIHSYLSYLRDRFGAARELLTETGSCFVQIGDENVHLVRSVLDEVFGSENLVSQIAFTKTTGATVVMLPGTTDYILWYAKDLKVTKYRRLFSEKSVGGEGGAKYDQVEMPDGTRRTISSDERGDPSYLPTDARPFRLDNLMSQSIGREKGEGAASWFPVRLNDQEFLPNIRNRWKTNQEGMARLLASRRIAVTGNTLAYVRYIGDFPAFPITNAWIDIGGIQSRADPKVYVVQTATTAVQRCVLMTTDPGDLVLDPTCGSGTMAYVAEQWGRRWITVDTSRVALALARTRLMAARYPYYLLADSPEGTKKEAEVTGLTPPAYKTDYDIRKGFVYKRVPHVTLKSIANNPDIKEGMSREEIDAAIARHADTETLYDQPYEDHKRIRVSGPFTVESLSPHRVLSTDEERPAGEREALRHPPAPDFAATILDYLRKSGVQNARSKDDRLKFDRLERAPGPDIQAIAEYTDKLGATRKAAICVGGETETVGSQRIREAAVEAMKGVGVDLLVVCGMAFDAHASETAREISPEPPPKSDGSIIAEETRQYGKLPVLLARMNPDLAMGDELLKKTGAGNLFMVFGEPDLTIEKQPDGKLVVEIKGVDVYDPTTGQIRSSTTDDIACWFIDTNYNEESFFVRHAYFTGADEPYERLKRALRAEIDEAAWSTLYSTRSYPFDPPETGKIAVKIINHYGDEVLKVYEV
jgi:adenine-specific DNA-methyltransferase